MKLEKYILKVQELKPFLTVIIEVFQKCTSKAKDGNCYYKNPVILKCSKTNMVLRMPVFCKVKSNLTHYLTM